jgi:hypothetical protein
VSDLTYTVTIDGLPWHEDQLRRVEYERTLHVLHELKALGVPLKDGDRELSHIDLNWLDPERARRVSLDAREGLGEDGFLELYRETLADSERRWKEWASNYDPAQVHTAEIIIEANGIGIQETMSVLGGAADHRDALSVNPEHFIVIGDIETGQRGAETFGMFGGPIYMHGVAHDTLPEGLPVQKDPTFPIALFGEMATKSDDTNFHVGALHQFRPTEDGFVAKSIFIAPGKAPKAIADGHKIHFALEIVNSMYVAHARQLSQAAEDEMLLSAAPATAGGLNGTWNVEARGRQGTLSLQADGSTLSGRVDVMGITADIHDGKVNGSSFTGRIEAHGLVGPVKARLSGTSEGDTLSGAIKVGIVKTPLTGTRASA